MTVTTSLTIFLLLLLLLLLLLNSMEQSPNWEDDSRSASQVFPNILWCRRFITVFTRARHCTLMWARWIQSTHSYPFLHVHRLKFVWNSHLHYACYMPRTSHDFIIPRVLGAEYKLRSYLSCNCLYPTVTFSLLWIYKDCNN
jgi:hypothetical protein